MKTESDMVECGMFDKQMAPPNCLALQSMKVVSVTTKKKEEVEVDDDDVKTEPGLEEEVQLAKVEEEMVKDEVVGDTDWQKGTEEEDME